ncbi:MAG: hypothetical protein DDT40_01273 [candidate division WS2 bacterium]|nr:hypothetical protein [Candidatus Psychracetigena formicireducens]
MSKSVIFSNKAFLGILVETKERIRTETGGIFLGHRSGDTWYVIESIDPGPNSTFSPTYFEYDQPYVTHLANKVARLYNKKLQLVGLWHRHPGSMDTFSQTDNGTNRDYVQLLKGSISGLVNLVPDFRLTLYYVDVQCNYERIFYKVGDSFIPEFLLHYKDSDQVQKSLVSQASEFRSSHQSGLSSRFIGHSAVENNVGNYDTVLVNKAATNNKRGSDWRLKVYESLAKVVKPFFIDMIDDIIRVFKSSDIDSSLEIGRKKEQIDTFLKLFESDQSWLKKNNNYVSKLYFENPSIVLEVEHKENAVQKDVFRFQYKIYWKMSVDREIYQRYEPQAIQRYYTDRK